MTGTLDRIEAALAYAESKHLTNSDEFLTVDVRALVEVAKAAQERVEYGHNDTCDTELSPGSGYACTCGHDDLAAALARLEDNQ